MSPRRSIAAAAIALALLVPSGAPATASAQGDSAAVAVNTRDGSSVFRLMFSVRRAMGDVVDTSNAAVAYSSCDACQTVAIAVQIVLIGGDADTVTPTNLALALNEGCSLCETFASAYQFVFGDGSIVRLTGEGQARIAELRRELRALAQGDLSLEEIAARTDAVIDRLREVLATQLVAVPGAGPADPEQPVGPDGAGEAPGGDGGATTRPAPPATAPAEPAPPSPAPGTAAATTADPPATTGDGSTTAAEPTGTAPATAPETTTPVP